MEKEKERRESRRRGRKAADGSTRANLVIDIGVVSSIVNGVSGGATLPSKII